MASARNKMIAFADPVFNSRSAAQKVALRSLTSFYKGTEFDIQVLGKAMPQLPGTRAEVNRIATNLNVPSSDIMLGEAATETAVK